MVVNVRLMSLAPMPKTSQMISLELQLKKSRQKLPTTVDK